MEYHEAVNFLFDLRRFQVKPGTESVRDLLSELGDPHEDVTFVQVAGSNGKGSTARMVESTLRQTGLTVGLYTSPHFDDLRERVRVDGRKVPKRAITAFVEQAKPYLVERAAAGEPLTFFETVTALALWQFGRTDTDVAVLEVGMGGELDATSVVDPVAAGVTNVSLEHTAVLGETVEEIATTKAAIAPDDIPLVTAATGTARRTILDLVEKVVVVGTEPTADVRATYHGRETHVEARVSVEAADWRVETALPLLGSHQALNAGIAVVLSRQVADSLGVEMSVETLERGLRSAHWPGRFEVMSDEPLVVLDGAHNPGACEQLTTVLEEFDYERLHLVFGAMHDKDHRGMVESLPTPDTVVTCRPNLPRAEDSEILARVFEARGVEDVEHVDAVANALAVARDRAEPGDAVLVTGSLFLVGEARTTWTRRLVPKRVRDCSESAAVLRQANVTEAVVEEIRSSGAHHVVKTRMERRQAERLTQRMLAVGGECATSGHRSDGELSSVVLMGTSAQFERLCSLLAEEPLGLAAIGSKLARRLDNDRGEGERLDDSDENDRPDYPWSSKTAVMGILNVTPDSFYDGGEYYDLDDAVAQAEAMVEAGADIVDIGGESTRPGAEAVSAEEEQRRIVPVIEALAALDVLISVDTRKASVAAAALDAGADIINDVTGLDDPEMRFLIAEREVPVIVMHSIDTPVVSGKDVEYDDVVEDVLDELTETVLLAEKAGIPRHRVVVDPGLGFGKSGTESFALLDRLDEFRALDCPVLIGHSHKSMFDLVGRGDGERGAATVAATALAAERGAAIVRVHDVAENVDAVRVAAATRQSSPSSEGDLGTRSQ